MYVIFEQCYVVFTKAFQTYDRTFSCLIPHNHVMNWVADGYGQIFAGFAVGGMTTHGSHVNILDSCPHHTQPDGASPWYVINYVRLLVGVLLY